MAKYKVKQTSILHNGELYKEGSIIELEEKHAAKLEDFVEYISNQAKQKAETQNKTQTSKGTTKTKQKTKSSNADNKDDEQNGGVNDYK